MHRYKQFISLGIVFLGSMSFLDVAQAEDPYLTQPPPDPFFWRKPEEIRPDLYPEQAREGRSDDVPVQYGAISRSYIAVRIKVRTFFYFLLSTYEPIILAVLT
jgi:hypothetical protein